MANPNDTLQSTFELYFGLGKNEECGTEVKLVNGELTTVVVDKAKNDAWLAQQQAIAGKRSAEFQARLELDRLYDDR